MSYTFSRRRTRVQQPPKVCKSNKKPLTIDPWPTTISATIRWSILNPAPFRTSTKNYTATLTHTTSGHYITSTTDDQGRSTAITIDVPIGTQASSTVDVTNFGPTNPELAGQGSIYDGTPPLTQGPHNYLAQGIIITGTSTWQIL